MVTSSKSTAAKAKTEENAETTAEETTKKTVDELAAEVLGGKWGYTYNEVSDNLENAGHDQKAVQAEVAYRVRSGAPSPLRHA